MSNQVNSRRGERYFFAMALLLLAINIAGFSLFAIQFPDRRPSFTFWLNLHALTSFAWLLLFVAQTYLVRHSRIAMHKRVGQWSGLIATGLVLSGVMVAIQAIQRTGSVDNASFQFFNLVNFSLLIALGLIFRNRRDQHKRFMLLASLSILAPGLFRLLMGLGLPELLIPAVMLVLLLSLISYDLIRFRRVKWATVIGTIVILLGIFGGLMLNASEWWNAWLTRSLL